MQPLGHRADATCDGARPERGLSGVDPLGERRKEIRARADGGVEDADALIGECELLLKTFAQALGDELRLRLDDGLGV